jgi:hypothetical protein
LRDNGCADSSDLRSLIVGMPTILRAGMGTFKEMEIGCRRPI